MDSKPKITNQKQLQSPIDSFDNREEDAAGRKHPGRIGRARRRISYRHRAEMKRNGLVGLGVGAVLAIFAFWLTSWAETQRFEHQQVLENTRFARQLSLTDGPKPLSGLNFVEAELSGLELSNARLNGAELTGADLRGTRLVRANLERTNLTRANLYSTNLFGTKLHNANLNEANLEDTNLVRANLTDADLTGAEISAVSFYEADLTDAEFTGANLNIVDFAGADLTGANLADAEFISANLCYDSSTVWPEGFEIKQEPQCSFFKHPNDTQLSPPSWVRIPDSFP